MRGAAKVQRGGAFVVAYDTLGRMRWATVLGGKYWAAGRGIAVDGQGNIYVSGNMAFADFPVTPGAAQPHGGAIFVASFDAQGRLRWATHLGIIRLWKNGTSIAVDPRGNVYVTGDTWSDDFPVTPDAAQAQFGGYIDAFLVSYYTQGRLRWATYLGGSGIERRTALSPMRWATSMPPELPSPMTFPLPWAPRNRPLAASRMRLSRAMIHAVTCAGTRTWAGWPLFPALGIAIDAQGNLFVTGQAFASPGASPFPVTLGSVKSIPDAGNGIFAASYTSQGAFRWATYVGWTDYVAGTGIATDGHGSVYITGATTDNSDARFPIHAGGRPVHLRRYLDRRLCGASRPPRGAPPSRA